MFLAPLLGLLAAAPPDAPAYPPAAPLTTRWAAEVNPEAPLPEYPRPQLVRERWLNLNGRWDYRVLPAADSRDRWADGEPDGTIVVPFPIESALSGVTRRVGPDERLWYSRTFAVPADWSGDRVLLHFGAVDWRADVWVNGVKLGSHRGGYDPFTFDATDALNESGEQTLTVAVRDPTDAAAQPRGKQVRDPRGIWYTPATGIWQTVWLEPVPETAITGLTIEPDFDRQRVRVTVAASGDATVRLAVREARAQESPNSYSTASVAEPVVVAGKAGEPIELTVPIVQFWSPREPWLYALDVELIGDGAIHDSAGSYFALRKVELKQDEAGVPRFFLNNEPLFQYGPLDQGYWPDGNLTAPTDAALRYDLEVTKRLGFNMVRKHVKVEPARWYHHCDRLGLLVWQDMPSGFRAGGRGTIPRGFADEAQVAPEDAEQFEKELTAVVGALKNHPSIVAWVPFNEGWGQYDTARVTGLVRRLDPTRLVINPSGWEDRGVGDAHDIHAYPGPAMPALEEGRAAVLGEFGGLGLPLPGHTWQDEANWGYKSFETREALTAAYLDLTRKLEPLIARGLAAAVYTQTTDVEVEVNGLMTYDREVIKMPEAKLTEAHARLTGR